MGVHLGVDEAAVSDAKQFKQLQKDMTASERFQARMEVRTSAWHSRRHELAQRFLDRFMRQNIAEIDEIIAEETIKRVYLTAAERAVYLELDHHLKQMDSVKKSKKTKGNDVSGDREARLAEALGASGSPEEALLKRCSHFDLDGSCVSPEVACDQIVELRKQQLEACEFDLMESINQVLAMRP